MQFSELFSAFTIEQSIFILYWLAGIATHWGMKLKSDAQSALRSMKDEASDICYDAKVEAGINDEEEVTE